MLLTLSTAETFNGYTWKAISLQLKLIAEISSFIQGLAPGFIKECLTATYLSCILQIPVLCMCKFGIMSLTCLRDFIRNNFAHGVRLSWAILDCQDWVYYTIQFTLALWASVSFQTTISVGTASATRAVTWTMTSLGAVSSVRIRTAT